MIISLKEDFDRELGINLPMISRAGQSTIPHHLCFSNAPGNKKEFNFTNKDDNIESDISMLLGGERKNDLAHEMRKITALEQKLQPGGNKYILGKQPAKKARSPNTGAVSPRTSAGFFMPFNQSFGKERGRNGNTYMSQHQKSSSFHATTRNAWQDSHASKTDPPEVAKYTPKYSQVEKIAVKAVIRNIKKNVGQQRIMQREL